MTSKLKQSRFDRFFGGLTGGDDVTKGLGKDAVKRLKELGVFNTKGDLEERVELVPAIERMWNIELGNLNYILPPGTIYELLCSYCLPFLFYKQTILFNRVCFFFKIN